MFLARITYSLCVLLLGCSTSPVFGQASETSQEKLNRQYTASPVTLYLKDGQVLKAMDVVPIMDGKDNSKIKEFVVSKPSGTKRFTGDDVQIIPASKVGAAVADKTDTVLYGLRPAVAARTYDSDGVQSDIGKVKVNLAELLRKRNSEAKAQKALPEVNQALLDHLKSSWAVLELSTSRKDELEVSLRSLLDALQKKDYAQCEKLTGLNSAEIKFSSLHAAIYGKSNRFLYGEDGWKSLPKAAATAFTHIAVDPNDRELPVGSLNYIVTAPEFVSNSNPLGLVACHWTPATSRSDIAKVILNLKASLDRIETALEWPKDSERVTKLMKVKKPNDSEGRTWLEFFANEVTDIELLRNPEERRSRQEDLKKRFRALTNETAEVANGAYRRLKQFASSEDYREILHSTAMITAFEVDGDAFTAVLESRDEKKVEAFFRNSAPQIRNQVERWDKSHLLWEQIEKEAALGILFQTSLAFGEASDSSTENQKQSNASERPATTNSNGLDPRITTTRLSIRDRLKARAEAQKALPEVNQALVDDMKNEWVGIVKPADMPAYERQMAALARAYQEGDEEAWKKLTAGTKRFPRDFEPERLAFTGKSMHFISGIDGFETNAGVQIRCFFPIDKDGNRVGTELHFIVTGLSELNGENVTAIVHSGTGDLPTENDVKGAMASLAKKYSLPADKLKKIDSSEKN
ncbi:hypothetical protein [Aporhodopirellula aestuarii]|uniref:Uncharacterized protein n=1 Tax=Aporhodopirellula aestuarii TaxID=2950107 RepID=A0ABT0UE05_9BACT|nr:hypothetical protein [Aporhodopirellula aestuarii]MCM2374695.1 hypothetical protein [Aporhodopirellula aestuarii]